MPASDLRYHIASLAGVFLALGIGILIGTAFVGAPVVQRQTGLIQRLEANVTELSRETRDRETSEEALRQLTPQVVQGTLAGRRVLVVQSGPYADATAQTAEALTAAGATVTTFVLPVETWRKRLEEPEDTPEALASEARRLAPLLLTAAGEGALESYRAENLVTGGTTAPPSSTEGPTASRAIRLVVLVGGAQGITVARSSSGSATTPAALLPSPSADAAALLAVAQLRDAAMIEVWKLAGMTVAGVEPSHADVSFMRLYQTAGADVTVDNIDRAVGGIALPLALRGEGGNYGQKTTADRVLPLSVTEKKTAAPTTAEAEPALPSPSAFPLPSFFPSSATP